MQLQQAGLQIVTVQKSESLKEDYIKQIVHNSRQNHILDMTPNDASSRFATATSTAQRLLYHDITLVLVDQEYDQVAGLAWFSPQIKSDVQADVTYAHRLYEKFTGRGLSIPFAKASHAIASRLLGNVVSCVYTHAHNAPAIRTYEAVGYEPIYESNGRLRMRSRLKVPEWYEQA